MGDEQEVAAQDVAARIKRVRDYLEPGSSGYEEIALEHLRETRYLLEGIQRHPQVLQITDPKYLANVEIELAALEYIERRLSGEVSSNLLGLCDQQ